MSPATRQPGPGIAARILVFDSGVGGLSITTQIGARLPGCSLIYASDNAAFPYGTKSESALVARVDKVLRRLLDRYPADMVVVACNSASTLALPHIRSHFDLPIVGVVPAIKPAAALTRRQSIGLLATPGTVSRQYTRDMIAEFAPHCRIVSVGSSELVELAENHLRGRAVDSAQIKSIIAPFFDRTAGIAPDVIVLACTHFPLLRAQLTAAAPCAVHWIDSGEAIARRVEQLLAGSPCHRQPATAQHLSLFTADTADARALQPLLCRYHSGRVHFVDIP